jgi:ATP-dependent DNA ligase
MLDFVNLMEGRSIGLDLADPKMDQYWYSDNWILEPIYQGKRSQCLISKDQVSFQGKKSRYKEDNDINEKIQHIITDIESLSLPSNTLLDGFFAFDNDDSTVLYRFLSLKNLTDIEELYHKYGAIRFYVTDLIYFDGKPVFSFSLFDRKKQLSNIIKQKDNIKLQSYYFANKLKEYNELKNIFKVFVFKKIESVYKFGISSDWMIFKLPNSYNMIIIGFIENDKEEFRHMVLALEAGQLRNGRLEKIMNIPVHGSENRLFFFQKKEELKGKVFEIKALEKKSGKYQEARFFCLRPDLTQHDCVFEEE